VRPVDARRGGVDPAPAKLVHRPGQCCVRELSYCIDNPEPDRHALGITSGPEFARKGNLEHVHAVRRSTRSSRGAIKNRGSTPRTSSHRRKNMSKRRRRAIPRAWPLLLGDAQGLAIQFLGGLGIPLPQRHPVFVPVQLRCKPALPCPFKDRQRIVQQLPASSPCRPSRAHGDACR
jgi:hypothetical protein